MNKCLIWTILALSCAATAHGQVTMVQINTDALGHDIIGDAANEPSLAVDPNNPSHMAVGWRQFDTITSNFRQAGVAYTTDGGRTWTSSVLTPGLFRSDPCLRADADGNIYYSSLSQDFTAQVFKSTNGGATWGPPVSAAGGDKQWIAVDKTNGPGRGNVYQDWNLQFTTVPGASFTRSTNGGASFDPATPGPSTLKWGTMAVGPNGTLYAAGSNLGQTGHLFSVSTNAQFAAQTPTFTTTNVNLGGVTASGTPAVNPGGLLGQVSIAAANSGVLYMLASVDPPGPDPLDVMFTRSTNGGATWSTPVKVNNNPAGDNSYQWFGTMSVAPNGRIDAIWNDTSVSPTNALSVLKYAYSLDGGTTWLGQNTVTAPFDQLLGFPAQDKIGDYYDMTSDDMGANLVFSATFTGGQDVYYMHIAAVPEPSSAGLVLVGGLAWAWRRRKLSATQ